MVHEYTAQHCSFSFVNPECLQYLEDGSKAYGSREPDYAGQYSPWSCDTIGSYIGSKDAKSKDVSSAVEMMASDLSSALCSHTSTKTVKNRGFICCFVPVLFYDRMRRGKFSVNLHWTLSGALRKPKTTIPSFPLVLCPLCLLLVPFHVPLKWVIRPQGLYRP